MQATYRTKLIAAAGILLGGLMTASCSKAPQAPPQAAPPEVGVVTVQPQRVAITTELSGRTSAFMVAEVRPQVGGIIQKRVFTEGSEVTAGQVLYRIDPASYQAAYASAKAVQARAGATLIAARLKASRYQDLVKIKAVSQQDNDDAQAALMQSEADVAAAKAAVDTAQINLAYTRVTAPISGWIGRSTVTDGALVTTNQLVALATVQQLGTMYVDVTQSSAEMLKLKQSLASGLLKKGGASQARVRLLLEDGSSYPLPGTLKFSEVTVDQSTGSITLRAIFPNPGGLLLPGMYVRAEVAQGTAPAGLLAPQQGISRDEKGLPTAMVVDAQGRAELRSVQTDGAVGNQWLIRDGLKPGDRLIVEGLQKVKPGAVVRAVAANLALTR